MDTFCAVAGISEQVLFPLPGVLLSIEPNWAEFYKTNATIWRWIHFIAVQIGPMGINGVVVRGSIISDH